MVKKTLAVFAAFLLILSMIAGSFIGGYFFHYYKTRSSVGSNSPAGFDLLEEALVNIRENYYTKIDSQVLIEGALEGMVKSLKDPYAEYLLPKRYQEFNQHLEGNYSGVGLYIGGEKNRVYIISVFDKTPAKKAGLREGDYIEKVNGKSVKTLTINQVASRIKGKEGTKVRLDISRNNKKMNFVMTRRKIELPNVVSRMSGRIGYVKVHSFTRDVASKVKSKLLALEAKKPKGIILDLRGNPGGELDQAIELVGLFMNNVVVVRTKSRKKEERSYSTDSSAICKRRLVVLVDKSSASASEIVAGALQDHKRATLVGERTFGKGSVQDIMLLSNKGAMIVPTQKWYTPSWRQVDKKGITPDIQVKFSLKNGKDAQLEKAKSLLNK